MIDFFRKQYTIAVPVQGQGNAFVSQNAKPRIQTGAASLCKPYFSGTTRLRPDAPRADPCKNPPCYHIFGSVVSMIMSNRSDSMKLLVAGSVACLIASMLHVAIIIGGPDWYRFFGAGEELAQLAEQGSPYPAIITAFITLILGVFGVYGLSGARIIPKLPFLSIGLGVIAFLFLARGLTGVPLVFLVNGPHFDELRSRMLFMAVTSLISAGIGICYLSGFIIVRKAKRSA
jgi:putative oxidoreductase